MRGTPETDVSHLRFHLITSIINHNQLNFPFYRWKHFIKNPAFPLILLRRKLAEQLERKINKSGARADFFPL